MKKIYLIVFIIQLFSCTQLSAQTWNLVDTGIMNIDSTYYLSSLQADGKIILGLGRRTAYTFYLPGGILISNDQGKSWIYKAIYRPQYGPLPVQTLLWTDSILFAGTGGLGVYNSKDWGDTWIECNSGIEGNGYIINKLVAIGNRIYAATGNGVFVSENDGETWQEINSGLPFNDAGFYPIEDIVSSNDTLYAGINDWNVGLGGIYKTAINNIDWKHFLTTIDVQNYHVNCDVISLSKIDNRFYLQTWPGLSFLSDDNGFHWIQMPLQDNFKHIIKNGNIILAMGYKMYLSKDDGKTWNDITFNLSNKNINGNLLVFNAGEIVGNNIFAGTNLYGLWEISIDSITSITKDIKSPNSYILAQNYPNPFNPTTEISYSLPSASNVKLTVFNTLGQEVRVLEYGFKNAGNYNINFNASNLPSGIYFYKLEAGRFSQVKKMILIK